MTNNKATKSLNAPMVIVPKRNEDSRGWFSETFHEQRLRTTGITCRFVQDNQSSSKHAGTLRGLHFQLPPAAQAKLVSVLRGRILDVAVDVRHDSPTYGKHIATELSAESGHQLYIPVGFAHGFLTLEDDVVIIYKVSDYYAPTLDSCIRSDDPEIAIPWPCENVDMIISDQGSRAPIARGFQQPVPRGGSLDARTFVKI